MNARPLDVAIVDYGLGNLFSVARACDRVGLNAHVTSDVNRILNADGVILPGVGAFGDAMNNLRRLELVGPLRRIAKSGKPLIGICLGLQLLMSESDEFGRHEGLDILTGRVVHLGTHPGISGKKVPEVCWNRIHAPTGTENRWEGTPLEGLPDGTHMYFVHSFYVRPFDPNVVLSTTRYGGVEYCSAVHRDNIVAFQFHPERSGVDGLRIYQNVARFIAEYSSTTNQRATA